ncbi:DUF2061 domain-containing protein [Magnetospira sp. QH-2]|uniref:DUF2061 domain-containing protein n=1 Tax=Magnetospira sp. (strain QH-2) TaxID=1288970 RepID=UPI00130D6DB2|nr:DUF2061 domain-containing protein [Magnetospira sp. QH-2]
MKSFSWQAMGMVTMTAISYPHTESLMSALTLALTSSASGFVFFLMHERIWNVIRWGRK